jgi:hypothetical protein
MFDLIASGIQAYNQILMFIAALVFLGIGGLMLGNDLYWRVHARRASGAIIGVIANGDMFTAVYRYTLPDGQSHEAKADISTGWSKGYATGRVVPLLVSAHNPTQARSANNYLLGIMGVVFLVPGLWLAYTALTAFPVTRMTWIVAAAMLLYVGERGYSVLMAKGPRVTLAEWRQQHGLNPAASIDLTKVKPIEEIVSSARVRQAQADQSRKNAWAMPVLGIFAVFLFAVGLYQGYRIARLESAGSRVQGVVVRLQEESGSDGHSSYYPVVRYNTGRNATVEFKDSVGGNPPLRHAGDKVTVLFLQDHPTGAIIDRGPFWNWLITAILVLGGGFILALFVGMFRRRRPALASGLQQVLTPYPDLSGSRRA